MDSKWPRACKISSCGRARQARQQETSPLRSSENNPPSTHVVRPLRGHAPPGGSVTGFVALDSAANIASLSYVTGVMSLSYVTGMHSPRGFVMNALSMLILPWTEFNRPLLSLVIAHSEICDGSTIEVIISVHTRWPALLS